MNDLQKQLQAHDESVRQAELERHRIEQGLPAEKKKFSAAAVQQRLKQKEEEKGEEKVIDPLTIKIRKLANNVTEDELRGLVTRYGKVTRVKIPRDEQGQSKAVGFVTFESESACAAIKEEGHIKYEFYELPVEAAYFSAQM